MCFDSDEGSDVWNEKRQRARKEYRCCACHEVILRCDLYVRTSSLYEGSWSTFKHCLRCMEIVDGLSSFLDGVSITLDCDADPLAPGEHPELDALAFATRDELQGAS